MKILYYLKRNFKIQYNDFVTNTAIPGYKFTHCSEPKLIQILWHCIFYFSLCTTIIISTKFYDQYENQATLAVFEIMEQGIELPYPSVYLCLGNALNPEKLKLHRHEFLKSSNLTTSLEEIDLRLQSAFRFKRTNRSPFADLIDLFQYDIDEEKLIMTTPKIYFHTNDLLKDCFIQGVRYDCENLFTSIQTAPGFCLVYNSIYTEDSFHDNPNNMKFRTFSEFNEDWTINFKISNLMDDTNLLIYLIDPQNQLTLTDFPNYIWNHHKQTSHYIFNIQHYLTDENVQKLRLSQRNCIFKNEKFPFEELNREFNSQYYNQGICLNYCQAFGVLKYCECLPWANIQLFPKLADKSRICTLRDVPCYEDNYVNIRQTDCSQCLANCNYTSYVSRPEIKLPLDSYEEEINYASYHDGFYELTIDLDFWPVLYGRTLVIFSTTEFLLSLVSLASLFLGASFMTLFEVFYALTLRFICSYYVNWDYLKREFEKQDKLDRLKPLPCIDMSLKPKFKK